MGQLYLLSIMELALIKAVFEGDMILKYTNVLVIVPPTAPTQYTFL
jgi:hypothetical protein